MVCAQFGFGEGGAEVGIDAHDFAGRAHFGAEDGVGSGKLIEGQDGLFDRDVGGDDFAGVAQLLQGLTGHDAGGHFGEGDADRFRDKGHGAGRRGGWLR